jgi:hypothetical protein
MKRCFYLMMVIVVLLSACTMPSEVRREPLETRFTPEYDSIETTNNYVFDPFHMDFRMMPNTHSVHHSETYEVRYRLFYDNGSTIDRWETVDKTTFESAEAGLKGESKDV